MAFANLVAALIRNDLDKYKIDDELPSVHFFKENGEIHITSTIERIRGLTQIPSPYLGGKLLGAGGGGFLVFYVEPKNKPEVRDALSDLYELPFCFDTGGDTRITYYDQEHV